MKTKEDDKVLSGDKESTFEELAAQMYFDENAEERTSFYFSVCVFQITACIIMTVIIFIMSFSGPLKNNISEALDYFQSFELTGDDIKKEAAAMKNFLTDGKN